MEVQILTNIPATVLTYIRFFHLYSQKIYGRFKQKKEFVLFTFIPYNSGVFFQLTLILESLPDIKSETILYRGN